MSITVRRMRLADVDAADAIRAEAGWNQRRFDWKRLLAHEPDGCFVAVQSGQVVGSVTTTTYDKSLAWIGMMLVRSDYRRQGIGRLLMENALEFLLGQNVPCIRLDATPQGRGLYEQLGFEAEWAFHRWQNTAATVSAAEATGSGSLLCSTGKRILEQHGRLDTEAFGANRSRWIERLAMDSRCYLVSGGYAMGRAGSRADYIGPVISDSSETARRLLCAQLREHRPLFWDVPEQNPAAETLARQLRFEPVRPLLRMKLGAAIEEPQIQYQFAIGDPATG